MVLYMPGLCFARNWTQPLLPRLHSQFYSFRNPAPGLVALSHPCVYSCLLFTATQDITAFTEIRRSSPLTPFLGGLTTLRKASISFVKSVCPPDRPPTPTEQLDSHCTGFHQVPLKSDNNTGYFKWRPIYIFVISRSVLLEMRKASD